MHTSTQTMDLYMAELGTYPLLSRDQEVELAVRVEQGKDARRVLQRARPANAETAAVLKKAMDRGEQARQRLIECNLRLVVHLAHRYTNHGLPLEDLIQEGNIGLVEAVERYDRRKGARLATYAWTRIKRAILQAIASQGPPIRLPSSVNRDRIRLRQAAARLEVRLARSPAPAELAAELDLAVSRVESVQRWELTVFSLDTPVGADAEYSLGEVLPDHDAPPLDETMAGLQLQETLRKIMDAHLEPRERAYLCARFGLDGGPYRTLQQAASALGLTLARAQVVEHRALRQLRKAGALRGFWPGSGSE